MGRYLHEVLGGMALSRGNAPAEFRSSGSLDAIIHVAFNTNRNITNQNLYSYLEDNILLTLALADLPCHKFIYISSIDVYPEDDNRHAEDETIDPFFHGNLYSTTKLYAESIVQKKCKNHLILRPGLLLGKYSRMNSVLRVIMEEELSLTLSEESTFTCISYTDVSDFIGLAMERDLQGTYNLVANEPITLGALARKVNKTVNFGSFTYQCGVVANDKIVGVSERFDQSSEQVIDRLIKEQP